jgi:hypothetical protein
MPDKTTTTSFWFHSQFNAHCAGEIAGFAARYTAAAFFGRAFASFPPNNGSIIKTSKPLSGAALSPAIPA